MKRYRVRIIIGFFLAVIILVFSILSIQAFLNGDNLIGLLLGFCAYLVGDGIFWRVKNKDHDRSSMP